MTGIFLSIPRYDLCASLLHPSSCMLVNHGPSQQSSQEEYKPWKWGVTAQRPYYQRRSPRQDSAGNRTTRRPPDPRKECSSMVLSPVHQVWPKPFCKAQYKADTGRGEKTTSGNGQALSSPSPRGQWRTWKNGETACEIICGAPTTRAVKGLMR